MHNNWTGITIAGYMLSLSEISIIEQADQLGAKALGTAYDALERRWEYGLTDNETFIRLLFLKWYSISEPNWYNGLPEQKELSSVEAFIYQRGDMLLFPPENQFVIAVLSHSFPWCFGDEKKWQEYSINLFKNVETSKSLVFSNWQYLLDHTKEVNGLRKNIKPELHARFYGRGEMGRYLLHVLGSKL